MSSLTGQHSKTSEDRVFYLYISYQSILKSSLSHCLNCKLGQKLLSVVEFTCFPNVIHDATHAHQRTLPASPL